MSTILTFPQNKRVRPKIRIPGSSEKTGSFNINPPIIRLALIFVLKPSLGLARALALTLERIGTVTSINRGAEAALAPAASSFGLASSIASATPIRKATTTGVPASYGPGL